ncbi:MAG: class I SAM-dependent methyltransferase [Pseudomonadota bacterium]|nr:class I SAM-dependent methyltransferase [Pseudomonadota bacterium]
MSFDGGTDAPSSAIGSDDKRGGKRIYPGERGFLKRIHDSAWAWDIFQGPIYNRLIGPAAADYFFTLADRVEREAHGCAAPMRILDVGAGAGTMSLLLARALPSLAITGIDYSPGQVRAARRMKKRAGLDNCRFQLGNAMNIPFAAESFDLAISVNSIKHWPDPVRGLVEIGRVLRPRSRAFIAEVDRRASPAALREFADKYRAWFIWPPAMRWCLGNVVFGNSYTTGEVADFASRAGFSAVSIQEVPGPFFLVSATK